MKISRPYFVSYENCTPDEPCTRWYFTTEDDKGDVEYHGAFMLRFDADKAISNVIDENYD